MERPGLRAADTGSEWNDVVGPVIRPATLADRWSVTVEDIGALVDERRLLTLATSDGTIVIPVFQFDADLKPILSLSEVLHS